MTQNKANPKNFKLGDMLEHASVERCAERGCRFLIGKNKVRIIKCAKLGSATKIDPSLPMSDYLVFSKSGRFIIGVVELKSGGYKISHVRSQLKNGARNALLLSKDIPDYDNAHIFLILVRKRSLKRIDEQRLLNPLYVNGIKCKIHTCYCGSKFANLVTRPPCLR